MTALADTPAADVLDIATTLENGASADIWYDANTFADEDAEHYDEGDTLPADRIEQTQTAMTSAADLLKRLARSYIVILMDVDDSDWSPWPVEADTPAEAVEKARADWRQSIDADENEEPAEVVKVYRGTLSERVFDYDAPQDLSGGDPGYRLISKDGPVMLTLETPNGIEHKAAFATIAAAEEYLSLSTTIDPVDLKAGSYGIDAPHGVGSDVEAVSLAQKLGFDLFRSMGGIYYAAPGVAVSGNLSGAGWKGGFDSFHAAALAALATVNPDEV